MAFKKKKKKKAARRRPFRLLFTILALPATILSRAMGFKPARPRPFVVAFGEGWLHLGRIL